MSNHTPGPWIVDEINTPNGKSYQISHLWEDGCAGLADDGEPQVRTDQIADVHMDYFGNVALDNARLLAASPRMEIALMAILVAVQQGLDENELAHIEKECQVALGDAWGVLPTDVGNPDLASIKWVEPDDGESESPEPTDEGKSICRRCGHTYAEHDRSDKYTVEACAVDDCECGRFMDHPEVSGNDVADEIEEERKRHGN